MEARPSERTRARFGLAVLVGIFVALLSGVALLPLLGSPLWFLAGGKGA